MPAFIPYFAALIFTVFGIGFYFALLNFRKWSDKEESEYEARNNKDQTLK